jgi:hypothetical protein
MSRASQAVTGGPHLEWESIAFLALDVGRTKKWAPHSFACFANEWEGHNPTEVRVTVTRESLCLRSAFFHVEVVRIPLIAKNAMSGAPKIVWAVRPDCRSNTWCASPGAASV